MSKPGGQLVWPLFALAACAPGTGGQTPGQQAGEPIACALGGSHRFTPDCTVERSSSAGARALVVRRPDGSFRRLAVSKDGQQLVTADGADQAHSALKGGRF